MTAVSCPSPAACSMLPARYAAAAGTGASGGRVSVLVLKNSDLPRWPARWSTCCLRRCQPLLGGRSSRKRGRMLVMVCSFPAGEVAAGRRWQGPGRGLDVFRFYVAAGMDAFHPAGCHTVSPLPAQCWLDHRVNQVPLFTAMLLWSVVPDSTFVAILAVVYTLAVSTLPRYWWQSDRCEMEKQQGGVDRDEARCLQSLVHPKLEISEMASLGVFTFNFDSLLAKMGLFAFGCVLLVGLFNVGYSLVGVSVGQSVRRRVIKAQRHGDFRDRWRKRLGDRESGFRVTYQQPLPGSYFAGRGGASVPEELYDGAHGARNAMTRSESDKLRRAKAGCSSSNKSTPVGRHGTASRGESLNADSHNCSAFASSNDQATIQAGVSQLHSDRLSSNPSLVTKERRSIASKSGTTTSVRTLSEGGVDKPSKVPWEDTQYRRAVVRSGRVGRWHEKDELELKARVEELRRKVLAAEQNRQAAMRSLAEEKKRSLELEVKISRQKESAMALEEEVRVLKESHEALLTSLRKKYSSSVAARAAAALLYQSWDSTDENCMREMVH